MSAPIHQPRLLDDLPPQQRRSRTGLSVTGLVSYARCPQQCFWTVVEPLPRQASPAARLGSLVHGWIERRSSGQGSLLDLTALEGDARLVALQVAFLASPYADRRPRAAELPFAFEAGGFVVRGRVDAVYDDAGGVEVVDFKTGRAPVPGDPGAGWQLDLYALAAVDCWGHAPEGLRTTEWYVESGTGESRTFDAARLAAVRARLADHLGGFADGRFDTNPGPWCRRCDFVEICPAALPG